MPYLFAITAPVDDSATSKAADGMFERCDEASTTPIVAIQVAPLEHRVKDREATGSPVVMGPERVGEMGFYVQAKDTEHNTIERNKPWR